MRFEELPVVLIKGAGEHSSGTAHRLFSAGFKVVMTEIENPTCVRRRVSFASAVFEGKVEVEGVLAKRVENVTREELNHDFIPVVVTEYFKNVDLVPDIVIDGRIAKRNIDNSLGDAQLVIGYGPGLVAGKDVHYVVETNRGHYLGTIIREGMAQPNTGVPGNINGVSAKRVLRGPAEGRIRNIKDIGDVVKEGETIAMVGDVEIPATIDGVIRGLVYDGTPIHRGMKIGDIDPRGEVRNCYTLSDKTRTISGATLEIICSWIFSGKFN
jgi:xanthine dehydrogenase accessory factor